MSGTPDGAGPRPARLPFGSRPTDQVGTVPGGTAGGRPTGSVGDSGTTTYGRPLGGATNGLVPAGAVNPPTVADPALIAARMGSDEVLASRPTMNR
nr:hypothetical protein [Micromonospora sp. DSM 115978]